MSSVLTISQQRCRRQFCQQAVTCLSPTVVRSSQYMCMPVCLSSLKLAGKEKLLRAGCWHRQPSPGFHQVLRLWMSSLRSLWILKHFYLIDYYYLIIIIIITILLFGPVWIRVSACRGTHRCKGQTGENTKNLIFSFHCGFWGIELEFPGLCDKCFYLLGYLNSLICEIFTGSLCKADVEPCHCPYTFGFRTHRWQMHTFSCL